jgi:hypothetical protein
MKVFVPVSGSNFSERAGGDADGSAGSISEYDGSEGERWLPVDDIASVWNNKND